MTAINDYIEALIAREGGYTDPFDEADDNSPAPEAAQAPEPRRRP